MPEREGIDQTLQQSAAKATEQPEVPKGSGVAETSAQSSEEFNEEKKLEILRDRQEEETAWALRMKYFQELGHNVIDKLSRGRTVYDDDYREFSEEEFRSLNKQLVSRTKLVSEAYANPHARLKTTILSDLVRLAELRGELRGDKSERRKDAARWAVSKLDELMPQIASDMGTKTVEDQPALKAFQAVARFGNPPQRQRALVALSDRLPVIEKMIIDGDHSHTSIQCLDDLLEHGTNEQAIRVAQTVENTVMQRKGSANYPSLVSVLFKRRPSTPTTEWGAKLVGRGILAERFEQWQLPTDEVVSAWEESSRKKPDRAVYMNLERLQEIESIRPGIAKVLYEEFGILDFGRYPADLLIAQYDERDSPENPYGVIAFPRSDWNGAFYNPHIFEPLYKETHGRFNLRAIECGSKYQLVRTLVDLNKRYNPPGGKGHKISLLVLGGHGTKDNIKFGSGDKRHYLFKSDLLRRGALDLRSLFDENPTLILNSCSTGFPEGIGQELSGYYGAKLIAPKTPSGTRELHASKKPGRPWRFNARYQDETKATYVGGEQR